MFESSWVAFFMLTILTFLDSRVLGLELGLLGLKLGLLGVYLYNLKHIYPILNRKDDKTSFLWLLLWSSLIYKHFRKHKLEKNILSLFFQVCIGIFLADLTSGFVHIYLDFSQIQNNKSLIDSLRIGFRNHHLNPIGQFMNDSSYRAYHEMNMVYPYATIILWFMSSIPARWRVTVLSCVYGLVLQQTAHYWCHARTHNQPMVFLGKIVQGISIQQYNTTSLSLKRIFDYYKFNILLNPIVHQQHHIDPDYNTDFCILTGWANPLLNQLNTIFRLNNPSSFFITYFDKLLN